MIDVSGGDKIPRKGGYILFIIKKFNLFKSPGITQSDLLVINKTDLAELVGADLSVMDRDAKVMRGKGDTLFTQVKHGQGVDRIIELILAAWKLAVE